MAFWTTPTKRNITMAAMAIAGWHALSMTITQVPQLPEILTKSMMGGVSVLSVAGAMTVFGAYMLFDNQLNG